MGPEQQKAIEVVVESSPWADVAAVLGALAAVGGLALAWWRKHRG